MILGDDIIMMIVLNAHDDQGCDRAELDVSYAPLSIQYDTSGIELCLPKIASQIFAMN